MSGGGSEEVAGFFSAGFSSSSFSSSVVGLASGSALFSAGSGSGAFSSALSSALGASAIEGEVGAFLRAVQQWADRTPDAGQMLEKKVPAAPVVARLLDKLGHEQAPAALLTLIERDPDPQVRGLLVHSAR